MKVSIVQYGTAELIVNNLSTEYSMVILVVVFVEDSLYCAMTHGADGCGKIVDRKYDGYFGCAACRDK